MAVININIPDAQLPRIIDAVAAAYGWDSNSGVTKNQFARQQMIRWLKDTVKSYEAVRAAEEARKAAEDAAENELGIT